VPHRHARHRPGRLSQAVGSAALAAAALLPRLGKWRWLGGLFLLSLPLVQLLPMMALLWSSFTPFLQVPSVEALGQLSFANYALAFND